MMANYIVDDRVVLTLDAGGTNLVFSAIKRNDEIVVPITKPTFADQHDKCLSTIVEGFEEVLSKLKEKAVAISFAFPGPADYEKGIIGDLPNFPAFKGGTPLGPMLEDKFQLPVFINNDGNLFSYGEALTGFLPYINQKILNQNGIKQYRNLIGITLGTGFGCGVVLNNNLLVGDSSCGAEIHNTLNKFNSGWNAEESVSTRAIQRVYAESSNIPFTSALTPKDIYDITIGTKEGNQASGIKAFHEYGEALGSSVANILTLIDGLVVLGGGVTAAWHLFAPSMFEELNRKYTNFKGIQSDRLSFKIYDLEDEEQFRIFTKGEIKKLIVPGSAREIEYDGIPRTGIGFSKLGCSKATALGAYAFALQQIDQKHK